LENQNSNHYILEGLSSSKITRYNCIAKSQFKISNLRSCYHWDL